MRYSLFSPAKLNLYLKILGINPENGYHFLDMVMVPVTLGDTIEVEESSRFSVETRNIAEQIPTEKNIVYKIYKSLELSLGRTLPLFSVVISKNTPTGGGMGGGSSNGAEFLLFLNKYLELGLSIEKLTLIASKVGSDIPFFLHKSAAIVRGMGEAVLPISLQGFYKHAVVIAPDFGVNTKDAYSLYDKNNLTKHIEMNINTDRVIAFRSLKEWKEFMHNDFESVVFAMFPTLVEIKNQLVQQGADKAFMTGSGSVMVGLFTNQQDCSKACENLSGKYNFVRNIEVII